MICTQGECHWEWRQRLDASTSWGMWRLLKTHQKLGERHEQIFPHRQQEVTNPSCTSGLQNHETIHFCYLSHSGIPLIHNFTFIFSYMWLTMLWKYNMEYSRNKQFRIFKLLSVSVCESSFCPVYPCCVCCPPFSNFTSFHLISSQLLSSHIIARRVCTVQ
jgi:hypothetical protein